MNGLLSWVLPAVFPERTADYVRIVEQVYRVSFGLIYWANLLNGKVDDCALGDRAGGGLDRDCRRSRRSGRDEDIARAGTARDNAGGEDEGSEQPGKFFIGQGMREVN